MQNIKGTVKHGVIYPLESANLVEGQQVTIVFMEETPKIKPVQSQQKLSEFLLLPELEENDPFFERDRDTGREIAL